MSEISGLKCFNKRKYLLKPLGHRNSYVNKNHHNHELESKKEKNNKINVKMFFFWFIQIYLRE